MIYEQWGNAAAAGHLSLSLSFYSSSLSLWEAMVTPAFSSSRGRRRHESPTTDIYIHIYIMRREMAVAASSAAAFSREGKTDESTQIIQMPWDSPHHTDHCTPQPFICIIHTHTHTLTVMLCCFSFAEAYIHGIFMSYVIYLYRDDYKNTYIFLIYDIWHYFYRFTSSLLLFYSRGHGSPGVSMPMPLLFSL